MGSKEREKFAQGSCFFQEEKVLLQEEDPPNVRHSQKGAPLSMKRGKGGRKHSYPLSDGTLVGKNLYTKQKEREKGTRIQREGEEPVTETTQGSHPLLTVGKEKRGGKGKNVPLADARERGRERGKGNE